MQVDALDKDKTSGSKQLANGDVRTEGNCQSSTGDSPNDLMDKREGGRDESKIEEWSTEHMRTKYE